MLTAHQLFTLGLTHERNGAFARALRYYSSIVASWPNEIASYHRLGVIAIQRKEFSLALAWMDKALAVNNTLVEVWNNRALALAELRRFDEAKASFEHALSIQPDHWESYYNLGRMLIVQERYSEAESILLRAVELDPYSAPSLNNLGLAYSGLCRFSDACHTFDRAIALIPDYIEAIFNKGAAFFAARNSAEAEQEFRRAMELAPNNGSIHCALAAVQLSKGNLADGFQEFEWRWKSPLRQPIRSYPDRMRWNGEPLEGQTLLVWPEGGFGDILQFIRYIPDLAKMDCELLVEVPDELYRLVLSSMSIANVRFVHSGAQHTDFEWHVPIMSVPRLLDVRYESFRPFKAYLKSSATDLDEWRRKLKSMTPAEHRKKKRIGITWRGNPKNPDDRNRSIPWETFARIIHANKRRFQFFNLQPGHSTGDADVIELGDVLRDFGTTAAIAANLDLVITVDTSLAHLAGAIGKRTWTLLAYQPDWRWNVDDERTPWYSSMLMISQKNPGNWDEVITDVNETLALE